MKALQAILTGLAAFVLGVSLLNDGGTFLALFIVVVIVAVALVIPFAKEYFLAASKGKWAGNDTHQDRREVREE